MPKRCRDRTWGPRAEVRVPNTSDCVFFHRLVLGELESVHVENARTEGKQFLFHLAWEF